MKKTKRILAIAGVILLASLYIATLIFAMIGSEDSMNWFRASIYATVVIPVLIWAYNMIYRLLKNHYSLRDDQNGSCPKQTDGAASPADTEKETS